MELTCLPLHNGITLSMYPYSNDYTNFNFIDKISYQHITPEVEEKTMSTYSHDYISFKYYFKPEEHYKGRHGIKIDLCELWDYDNGIPTNKYLHIFIESFKMKHPFTLSAWYTPGSEINKENCFEIRIENEKEVLDVFDNKRITESGIKKFLEDLYNSLTSGKVKIEYKKKTLEWK